MLPAGQSEMRSVCGSVRGRACAQTGLTKRPPAPQVKKLHTELQKKDVSFQS